MKRKGKGSKPWLLPFAAMPILTVIFSVVAAKLILSGALDENGLEWCAAGIAGIVSFLICIYSAVIAERKKFLWGMATATAYACLLLLGNLMFFGNGYGQNIFTICAAVILGGFLGTLLGGTKRRKIA